MINPLDLKYSRFAVISIADSNPFEWDDCVLNSEEGYVYTKHHALSVCEYSEGKNLSFAIKDTESGQVLLVMPLFDYPSDSIEDNQNRVLKSRYGPVIRKKLTKKQRIATKVIFKSTLDKILFDYNHKSLLVQLPTLCSSCVENNVNPLIFWGFEPRIRYSWICRLTDSDIELFCKLRSTTRTYLRKLLKTDAVVFSETSHETLVQDCKDFYKLNVSTYTRNGLRPKSEQYFQSQFGLIDQKECRVFFLRKTIDGMPLCAVMVHLFKNTARITWKVSDTERLSHIDELLIYKVIMILKESNIDLLEVGGAYPYLDVSDKRRRISDFKSNFTDLLFPIMMGEYFVN